MPTLDKVRVTIIVPTKNEEQNLREILHRIKPYGDELIVVDGHSTDNTREVAREAGAKVLLDHGRGKGDGLRLGIKEATGEIILFIDADQSHDPDDIPKVLAPIIEGYADHVSGSRMIAGSDELFTDFSQFLKLVGSCIITLGINYRFGVRLTDSQNGFRAIKVSVARQLDLKENITTIEQEMIIKTLKNGFRLVEVPTHEYARKYGRSVTVLRKVWFRYVYSWLKYLFF